MTDYGEGVEFFAPVGERFGEIVTPQAVAFVAGLQREFNARRKQLLRAREARQQKFDGGEKPDFLPDTKAIRESDWTVAPLPSDLLDRRVEITGPVDRKTIINALNSGAKVFMADFEDSTTPTWENLIEGQINLRDAIRRTITFQEETTGKSYKLDKNPAVLFVRVRGWHMEEQHMIIDGEPVSGSIFDFGMHFFHNAKELLARGSGPYFYLPKMESHLEARLWNEIFVRVETQLGVKAGSIKGTVLIETIPAAFEMDEILYELREHSAGLNCGRWDYIFSFIKKFAGNESVVLPDRGQVTMAAHFMRSYSTLCIKTCHRRRVSAMGGMSALIPIKDDVQANEKAMDGVRADKEREATDGHDGTWVAHPGLVPVALEVFNRVMPQPNQIDRQLPDCAVTAADLLQLPSGSITEAGLIQNVAVSLGYMEAWLRGIGCVRLFNLMEDAATTEISRAQLWQWVHHHARLTDGRAVTVELVELSVSDELARVKCVVGMEQYRAYRRAAELLGELIREEKFTEFLTVPGYPRILEREHYFMAVEVNTHSLASN